jgi:hypothetical protein
MARLPELLMTPWLRKMYEECVFDCIMRAIGDQLRENARIMEERKKDLRRSRRQVNQQPELITTKSRLAIEMGFAEKNMFCESGPIYKLTLIARLLDMDINLLIRPTHFLIELLSTMRELSQYRELTDEKICNEVYRCYTKPYPAEGIEELLREMSKRYPFERMYNKRRDSL